MHHRLTKLLIVITILSFFAINESYGVNWPLRISASGKYLEDQSGVPFLFVGDTAWSLAAELSPAQVVTYLDDRQAKGITAIIVNAIEHAFATNAPNNYNNDPPFTNGQSDWSARNEAYWSHVDYILNQAKSRGILVLLYPAYIGYLCGDQGWCAHMQSQTNAVMTNYGQWLGNRYKNQGNIIWVHGGDANANDYANAYNRVAAIGNGIKANDTNQLHAASSAPERSGMDDYNALIDINTVYTYGYPDTRVQTEYQRSGAKPVYFYEGYYENEHSSTIGTWQSQSMIPHLGGALVGQMFGNCPTWNFGAPSASGFCDVARTWTISLSLAGSVSQSNIGKLMRSRAWARLVPDYSNMVVTSSKGTAMNYHATARETNGETVMVWCPNTNQVTVDMTKISGSQAKCWWWNPDDNTSVLIGTYNTSGTRNFNPSSARKVLVLDNAASNLSAPGTTEYYKVRRVDVDKKIKEFKTGRATEQEVVDLILHYFPGI